ncbi:hypothetical protein NP233_g12778 [Leucocoprinus birnbaumii]|uniref:Uncharacterized protein n=1 Tax=Leucocoprinus birnbaumii TaxID=56174 RepID=A0AAD5YPN8_9AGAR|nr:hypothetical protein NP233_g12778 [Leucocoprinus birnbaumii]
MSSNLPPNVVAFANMFPAARVCRIISVYTGELLDYQPNLQLGTAVPQVVLNAESTGDPYWLIIAYGNGQVLVPVPKDGSKTVRYLAASAFEAGVSPTLSPFPVSWVIMPFQTSRIPPNSQTPLPVTTPPGLYEQWNAIIHYPYFEPNTVLTPFGTGTGPNHQPPDEYILVQSGA